MCAVVEGGGDRPCFDTDPRSWRFLSRLHLDDSRGESAPSELTNGDREGRRGVTRVTHWQRRLHCYAIDVAFMQIIAQRSNNFEL